MDRPETHRLLIRLNQDVLRWVQQQAIKDVAPMNSVINRALREAMEADQARGA